MTVLAAAGSDGSAPLLLVGLALLIGYGVACVVWPYAPCWSCKGKGNFRSPGGGAWRRCRRCKGSGERLRWGAALLGKKGKR